MKAQMKLADRSGAAVALIVGPAERADGTVTIRPLRADGEQRTVPVDQLVETVRAMTEGAIMSTDATSMRTGLCGRLGLDDVGRPVRLCGWVARRREHGEHLAFVDLRDHSGIVQCVVDGSVDLRSEYVVAVTGVVRRRPDGMDEPQPGHRRGRDRRLRPSRSCPPPSRRRSSSTDRTDVDEAVRLKNRYVDLRRPTGCRPTSGCGRP